MCTVQCLIQVFQTGREYFLGEYVEFCFADGISVKLSVGKEKQRKEKASAVLFETQTIAVNRQVLAGILLCVL